MIDKEAMISFLKDNLKLEVKEYNNWNFGYSDSQSPGDRIYTISLIVGDESISTVDITTPIV